MHLNLGQLVYTSFAQKGLQVLASEQVPQEIRQALVQQIAFQYWNSYSPPEEGYSAVYLLQVFRDHTLFGWFYNDRTDDVGRANLPYFIAYHLAEPLFNYQLENIFTCLQKGPIALIERQNPPTCLEPIIIPNLSYQPARPGLIIPGNVRRYSHVALKQKQLLKLFISSEGENIYNDSEADDWSNKSNFFSDADGLTQAIRLSNAKLETSELGQDNKLRTQGSQGQVIVTDPQENYEENFRDQGSNSLEKTVRVKRGSKKENKVYSALVKPVNALSSLAKEIFSISKFREGNTKTPNQKSFSANYGSKNTVTTYQKTQIMLGVGIAASLVALVSAVGGLLYTNWSNRNEPTAVSATDPILFSSLKTVPNVPQGLFSYSGATVFAPLRSEAFLAAIEQAHPRFLLRYVQPKKAIPGSSHGIEMLIEGELSFAQSFRPLQDNEIARASLRGFEIEPISVGLCSIVFYVNPDVSIPGLSLTQIRDIFTGKITNWQEVGGADLSIVPVSLIPEINGSADIFQEKVLAGEELNINVQVATTPTETIRQVAATPGAIGYAATALVANQQTVKPIPIASETGQTFVSPLTDNLQVNKAAYLDGSYPIVKQLFVIVKRDGSLDEQAGIAYTNLLLSNQGQKMLEEAGFLPIR